MKISLQADGLQGIEQAFASLSGSVSKRILVGALLEGAEPIRQRAEQNVTVGQAAPHIRDNVLAKTVREEDVEAAVAVGPSKKFFYGVFLELGTVKMGARPWLRPAFDTEHPKALEIVGQAAWRELAARGQIRTATRTVGGLT